MDATEEAIRAGFPAAGLPADAGTHLEQVLKARRQLLIVHAMTEVTPIDLAASVGRSLWLKDRATTIKGRIHG